MTASRRLLLALSLSLCGISLAAPAQTTNVPAAQDLSKIKAADLAWMTGRWIGRMQNATAEQICSSVESGEMLCLFRVFVQGRPVMYELYTMYDTPAGPELRSLHFSTDLADKSLQQPLVMKLQKYSEKEVVFAGAPESELDTSTLARDSSTTMNGTIIFRDEKEPHIRVRWEKVAYDAKVDYAPPGK
jgi:uncharacterized protein DUF6265